VVPKEQESSGHVGENFWLFWAMMRKLLPFYPLHVLVYKHFSFTVMFEFL
jgi:hypothetical protein